MSLSHFCIRRPVFTILFMLALCITGLLGYRTLPVSALPNVDFPTLQVTASLPGANAETMASTVATPLERQFSTIAGISSMTSTSYLGITQVTLQFALERNLDGAALDVQAAIAAAQPNLPPQMPTPPTFKKVNPADQPVVFLSVSSTTLPLYTVDEYADTLMAQRISTLPGVSQVVIYGEQKFAVRVRVNPESLAARDLSLDDVAQSLSAMTSMLPPGVISEQKQLLNIDVVNQPKTATDFRSMIVTWKKGAPIYLSDVADVSDGVEDKRAISFLNGKQAIVLAVQKQPNANTMEVVESVKKLLPIFREQIPASIEIDPLFDRSVSIKASVEEVQMTLKIAVALVILVILFFLRTLSATFIPAIAIPLSLLGTYGAMAFMGFSLNNISLMAVILSIGFVVDDAIVMVENCVRHREKGLGALEAALVGSQEVGFTIISMTLSLVAVFIPVLFMEGIIGRLFREFAVTISMAILISGGISLTLTPMLCRYLLKESDRNNSKKNIPHISQRISQRVLHLFENAFKKLRDFYEKTLEIALHHPFKMLLLTLATFVLSVFFYIIIPKGLFPLEDTGFIFIQTEAAQDISFDAMVDKQSETAALLLSYPGVDKVFSAIGGSRGTLNTGRLFVGLKPPHTRASVEVMIPMLRDFLKNQLVGMNVYLQPVQNLSLGGRLTQGLYQYTLQGSHQKELAQWSEKIREHLRKVDGLVDVSSDLQNDSLQISVNVDKEKAYSLGISFQNIRSTLNKAFGDAEVGNLYTASNIHKIILEVDPAHQMDREGLKKLYVRTQSGVMIKLESVATFEETKAPLSVNHQGQLPAVTLSFNLVPGTSLGQAVEKIKALESELHLPSTILTSYQGFADAFKKSLAGMVILLLLAIITIYIILGMLYESFIHPLTILSGVPSAGLGALMTLMLCGMELSLVAIIGIILLIGIVKKNAIMIVDFALEEQKQGIGPEKAIYNACLLRFRPIMMTTMAAIFGALPVAIGFGVGSELRRPLGIAVVGGLLTSQLLTLYMTPIVYLYFEKIRYRWSK